MTVKPKLPDPRKILAVLSGPYFALLALILVCALTNDVFFSTQNLLNITRQVSYSGLIALGMTFIIIGGVIKLIPLTGVTMPFVSYGGTSLVACLCLIGLIQGVSSVNEDDLARDADLADYGGGAA